MFHLKINSRQLFYDQLSELSPFVFCSFLGGRLETPGFPDIFEEPEGYTSPPPHMFEKSLDSSVSWLVTQPKEASLEVIFDN